MLSADAHLIANSHQHHHTFTLNSVEWASMQRPGLLIAWTRAFCTYIHRQGGLCLSTECMTVEGEDRKNNCYVYRVQITGGKPVALGLYCMFCGTQPNFQSFLQFAPLVWVICLPLEACWMGMERGIEGEGGRKRVSPFTFISAHIHWHATPDRS